MTDMTFDEMRDELNQRQALIVHFSNHADMGREGAYFPNDLRSAIKNCQNGPHWPLSCSVLWPGHKMSPVGSVGLILELQSIDDIISVKKSDSGSISFQDGSEGSLGDPLTKASLTSSFEVKPGDYNEWRVKGAKPIGIFILDVANIEVRIMINHAQFLQALPQHMIAEELQNAICLSCVSLDCVESSFPEFSIQTIINSAIQTL
jgi:hypothetical protein